MTGDPLVDAVRESIPSLNSRREELLRKMRLEDQDFVYVTLHRPENVDY